MRPFLLSLALAAAAPSAWAQTVSGDPLLGERLAQQQCAECHLLRGAARATVSGVPAFHSVANDPHVTELGLRAFLSTPHYRMPDIVLTRREIDNLIAYIMSLKGRSP